MGTRDPDGRTYEQGYADGWRSALGQSNTDLAHAWQIYQDRVSGDPGQPLQVTLVVNLDSEVIHRAIYTKRPPS